MREFMIHYLIELDRDLVRPDVVIDKADADSIEKNFLDWLA
jgi:hypothetical protein